MPLRDMNFDSYPTATRHASAATRSNLGSRRKDGFALLITITLLAFLVVLLVSLAALTRVETTVASNSQQLAAARQNALMALNLAIGELQKNLGPDKRTSANAELVPSTDPAQSEFFETATNRVNRNPYWVGAWNTEGGFRGWLVSGNENIAQPADPKSDVTATTIPVTPLSAVSTAPITAVKPTGYSITTQSAALPTLPAVQLVGPATVGTTGTPAERYVYAPVRDITATPPGAAAATTIGRYAWWVGDEGVKANLASPVAPLPASTTSDRLKFLATPQNRGLPTLGAPWDRWVPEYSGAGQIPDFANVQQKILTRKQIPVASAGLVEEEKASFHDFTTVSAGVLSDSKNGGLRKDLSIAFELPEAQFKNTEFTKVLTAGELPNAYSTTHTATNTAGVVDTAFYNQVETNAFGSPNPFKDRSTKTAVNYRDDTWAAGLVYRGPTFDQLRDFYQLYRRVNNPMAADATVNAQTFLPSAPYIKNENELGKSKALGPWGQYFGREVFLNFGSNYAVTDTYNNSNAYVKVRPLTTELVPELLHFTYAMSLQTFRDSTNGADDFSVRLFIHPYVMLYNPYNVTLKSYPIYMRSTRAEMGAQISSPGITMTILTQIIANNTAPTGDKFGNQSDSSDATVQDSYDYYITDESVTSSASFVPRADSITLKPGEMKLYTLAGSTPTPLIDLLKSNTRKRVFLQAADLSDPSSLFTTGYYLKVFKDNGSQYKMNRGVGFNVKPNVSTTAQNAFDQPAIASTFKEFLTLLTKTVTTYNDTSSDNQNWKWPQIRQVMVYSNKWWTGPTVYSGGATPQTITPESIENTSPDGPKHYVGKFDLYWKPAFDRDVNGVKRGDNNFSLTTMNPRAMVQGPSSSGGQGPAALRGPGTWASSVTGIDGLTVGFNERFWGTGRSLNPSDGGQSSIVLWNVPRTPLTAISSFQNASLSRLWTSPAYALGNSYASPFVPADKVWRQSSLNANYWNLDDSYIFNDALFDSYYFSGVNPGFDSTANAWGNPLSNSSVLLNTADPTSLTPLQTRLNAWVNGTGSLFNPHHKFHLPSGRTVTDALTELNLSTRYATDQTALGTVADIRPHNAISAYLLNQGAFNVNSVSVEAWRTLLAGLRGAAVEYFSTPTSFATDPGNDQTPFLRAELPAADSATGNDKNLWNGFRRLSDPQIDTLAQEIVGQIKTRARNRLAGAPARPFTTLGEFINRRLAPVSDPTSLKGVLQAAIDTTINSTATLTTNSLVTSAETQFKTVNATPAEAYTTDYDNSAALAQKTIAGAPQWFSQADLLERLGPQLSARSDTFTVRTYGESVNPATGEVVGRAWLEAVVQRDTAYVNPADDPALPLSVLPNSPTPANPDADASFKFGRSFRVVSFRWLSPTDI